MKLLQKKELSHVAAGGMSSRLLKMVEHIVIDVTWDLVKGWQDKYRRRLEKKQIIHLKEKKELELEIEMLQSNLDQIHSANDL